MIDDRDETKQHDDEPADETQSAGAPVVNSPEKDKSAEDAVGAYLLDALPEQERAEFEAYLKRTPAAQAEIRELAPVVALLPKLLDLEIETSGTLAAPASELRDRIVAEAHRLLIAELPGETESTTLTAAGAVLGSKTRTIRTAPDASELTDARRAQGRIRSGVDRSGHSSVSSLSPISIFSRLPRQWAVAAMVSMVAVGAIIWALALQGRIDSNNRELAAQSSEIAELRQNANATSYTLLSSEGAQGAGGTLLFSLKDQIGVLYVHSLPALSPDEVYQLWYLDDESDSARPGGTFSVDSDGNGVISVASDTPSFDGVALTTEPEGGSQAPTSAILLQGRLGGAAG